MFAKNYLSLLLLSTILFFAACKGKDGANGLNGADGRDGNANMQTRVFQIGASDWFSSVDDLFNPYEYNFTQFTQQITQGIVDSGVVIAYISFFNYPYEWQNLPLIDTRLIDDILSNNDALVQFTYTYEQNYFSLKARDLYSDPENGTQPFNPSANGREVFIKLAVITDTERPAQELQALPHADLEKFYGGE
jgi:hypothetical protein